jgi:aminoglycoside phosphotransferase (APT) family kinase protein
LETFHSDGDRAPEGVFRCHPLWGKVTGLAPLGSGANNDLFKVDFGSHSKALKRTRPAGMNRLRTEVVALHALRGMHAPALAMSLPDGQESVPHLWMEFVPGEHRFDLDGPSATTLGRALRQIHLQTNGSPFADLASPTLETYVHTRLIPQLDVSRLKAPPALHETVAAWVRDMLSMAALFDADRESSSAHRCLVHTDVIPLNVIFKDSQAVLVDWELARFDFPEWDLASVEKAFRFGPDARVQFDRAYGLPIDAERLKLVSLLHYANVVLWRLCSFYARQENREHADFFLSELRDEMEWIRVRLRS